MTGEEGLRRGGENAEWIAAARVPGEKMDGIGGSVGGTEGTAAAATATRGSDWAAAAADAAAALDETPADSLLAVGFLGFLTAGTGTAGAGRIGSAATDGEMPSFSERIRPMRAARKLPTGGEQ